MPMLDLEAQQQHMTVFRLRFGEKGAKGEPRKLTDRIRVTSPSREVVERFVEVFGGEVQPWDSGGKGPAFEAYLPVTELPVYVLPGQSIRQSWERWRGGSQIERRCDSVTEEVSGNPCMCPPDMKARMASSNACKPTTYVTVICPTVSITWAGDFVSRGMTAAKTLPGSVNLVEELLARGQRVPATLRIVEHPGSRSYVIPVIIPVRFTQEMLDAGEVPRAITNGAPAQISGAEARALEVGSGAAARVPAEPSPRPAAVSAPPQPPLPHEIEGETDQPRSASGSPSHEIEGAAGDSLSDPAVPSEPETHSDDTKRAQAVAMWCREAGLDDDDRHQFLTVFSNGEYYSSKAVPLDALPSLRAELVKVKRGESQVWSGAVTQPTLEPAPAVIDVPLPEPGASVGTETHDQAWWLAKVADVEGVGQAKLLRAAREIAGELGVTPPNTLNAVPAEINDRLVAWIGAQG